jgi:hypothetical protein
MGYKIATLIIGVIWTIVCVYFIVQGGRNKRNPKPGFEKVPILFGIGVAGLLVVLIIIGALYFH